MTNRKTGRDSDSGKLPIKQGSSRESITSAKVFRDPRAGELLRPPGVPRPRNVLESQAVRSGTSKSRGSVRTTVELPQEQVAALAAIAKREHLPRAELVRQAVAAFLARQFTAPDDAAFGLWRDRQRDGLEYQVELRAEWDA